MKFYLVYVQLSQIRNTSGVGSFSLCSKLTVEAVPFIRYIHFSLGS